MYYKISQIIKYQKIPFMQSVNKLVILNSYFNHNLKRTVSFINQHVIMIIFVSFFTFYSYENIFFANSFKFVPLREVNELAFQISIREFYVDLVNLNFSSLFRSNDYGYGFIFWSIYGFFVTPFYFLLHSFPDSNLFSIFCIITK